jgi:uncharacterized protein (TIGR00730 family)
MKHLAVFCGSRTGTDPKLSEDVYALGRFMAANDIGLVYGGGKVGLMGRIADGVLEGGGSVTGVIPDFLSTAEVARFDLTRLEMVKTMDERKRRMFEVADLFLTIPGGFGTLDELFEAVTLTQVGIHAKDSWILNTNGFYDGLQIQIESMRTADFITEKTKSLLRFVQDFATLQNELKAWRSR